MSSAAAPPVKASSAVPCTANAIPRATISGASAPATSPSTRAGDQRVLHERAAPSSSPVPSKVKSRLSTSFMARPRRGSARRCSSRADDDQPAAHLHHVDPRPVELREHRRRHDLRGRADPEPPVHEVEHPVHQRQHRVDLVGDEQHGGAGGAAPLVDQSGDGALVGEVEREQRLVAQQHLGVADERLRHPQPLLLAAGEPPHRRVRVGGAADRLERRVHPRAPGPHGRAARARAGARPGRGRRGRGRAAAGRGRAPSAGARSRCCGLPAPRRPAADPHLARRQRVQPEQHRGPGSSCPSRWGRAPRRTHRAATSRSRPSQSVRAPNDAPRRRAATRRRRAAAGIRADVVGVGLVTVGSRSAPSASGVDLPRPSS